MIKLGVVGVGHMGRYHVNVLATLNSPKASLVAVCDSDGTRVDEIAKKYGIKGFTDYKKFLSSVDAVIVAVPTFLHYRFASEALEAGRPVLVEKPITKTIYYAEKLVELAQKKNLFLQVGHVERFNGAVQELQNVVKNPYFIQAQRLGPRAGRITDVGVVLDLMIHDIDIILSIAQSELREVAAHGHKIYTDHEDVANASLYFDNGVVANIAASRATENKIRTLAISQEDAFVYLDYGTQDITIYRKPMADYLVNQEEIRYKQEALVEKVFVHKDNALKLESEHFISCLCEEREPSYAIEANLEALRIAKQIVDKIYSGWDLKDDE